MMKAAGVGAFGRLCGSCSVPVGSYGSPYIEASEIGRGIKSALRDIALIDSLLRLLQYSLMPDHLHLLLSVEDTLDEHLGVKIAKFKVLANGRCGASRLFEEGYNDQIITHRRDLTTVFRYIRENPYRLAVRRERPEYFSRVNEIRVAERRFSAYGNLLLLKNPFKEQVVVHRRDEVRVRAANLSRWIYTASNGGVLVSPFISEAEKEIRRRAEENGGRIILISNEGFGERGKPVGHDFSQCERGNLLILTPTAPALPPTLTREACLAMNALAAAIANGCSR